MIIHVAVQGLRRAYFTVYPVDNDTHFEAWIETMEDPEEGPLHRLETYVKLCERALDLVLQESSGSEDCLINRAIIFACGYYEAQRDVVYSLRQPTCLPNSHFDWPKDAGLSGR